MPGQISNIMQTLGGKSNPSQGGERPMAPKGTWMNPGGTTPFFQWLHSIGIDQGTLTPEQIASLHERWQNAMNMEKYDTFMGGRGFAFTAPGQGRY